MRGIILSGIVSATCYALLLGGGLLSASSSPVALTGIVSSASEGHMEGVVVSVQRVGGTITVSVVTDQEGRYTFPADRLTAGAYQIRIRAVGYDLANSPLVAKVGPEKREVDIRLSQTKNLAAQLTSAEWLMSIPGTPGQKEQLFEDCVLCHSLTPIFQSTYDTAGWLTTLRRMYRWSVTSTLKKPVPEPVFQVHESSHGAKGYAEDPEFAKYLSSINLSSKSHYSFELKTMPRPRGDDTKVIVTEYDLPRWDSQPHEAVVDAQGMVWYSDYAEGIIGRLDPGTGEVNEWQDPFVKQGYNSGFHDLELDLAGNPWVGRHEYNGFAKLDKKTGKFTDWTIPQEYANPQARTNFLAFTRDGQLWIKDATDHKAFLFDPATQRFTGYNQFPDNITFTELGPFHHNIYGMNSDSEGNEYGADVNASNIVKIDLKTAKATIFPTPTPNAGPRRMHVDSEDRIWIGELFANKIAMFDTKTEIFQEWSEPISWYGPYDVVRDREGNVWTGGMSTDLIGRFNPKTMEFRHYPLPRVDSNVRRVDLDNSRPHSIFWVAENHRAKIAKVEPLD
jgi:virginiamycin B lyase